MVEPEQQAGSGLKKERSPSFPFLTLTKAVDRTRLLYTAAKRHEARMSDVADAWGMGAKSSATQQSIAALVAYGLVDDNGSGEARKFKVSELGFKVLEDQRPGAKEAALAEAALKPKLIAEYAKLWHEGRPSDAISISDLRIDGGFTDDGAKLFIRVFDDALSYAKRVDSDKKSDASTPAGETSTQPSEVAVGDLVQWEAGGALRLEKPAVVRAIREHEGTNWVFVEGSETGIPVEEVRIEQKGTGPRNPPTLPLASPPGSDEKRTPPPGMEVDRFTVDEGVVRIEFPKDMGADSVEELEQFFTLFIKKAKRRAALERLLS